MHWSVISLSIAPKNRTVRMFGVPRANIVTYIPMLTSTVHISRFRLFSVIRLKARNVSADLGVFPNVRFITLSGLIKSISSSMERTPSPRTQIVIIHTQLARLQSPFSKILVSLIPLIGSKKKKKLNTPIIIIIVSTIRPDYFFPLY